MSLSICSTYLIEMRLPSNYKAYYTEHVQLYTSITEYKVMKLRYNSFY